MGSSLTGTKIKDTYSSLIKVSDNGALDGTLQTITDGLGNNSALSLSTAGASVGGTLAVSGAATLSSTLGVSGAATLSSTLAVTGASTFSSNVAIGNSASSLDINPSSGNPNITLRSGNTFRGYIEGDSSGGLSFGSGASATIGMSLKSGGDISFRDSSANEAFYWDASAASLGIGGVPSSKFSVAGSAGNGITLKHSNGNTIALIEEFSGTQGAAMTLRKSDGTSTIQFNAGGDSYINGGNVGIGTSSPATKLDVRGNALKIYDSGSSNASLIIRNSTTGDTGGFVLQQDGVNSLLYNNNNGYQAFATNATERMRITSGGYLKASNNGTYYNTTGSYHELLSNASGNASLIIRNTATTGSSSASGIYLVLPSSDTSEFFLAGESVGTNKIYIYSNGNIVNANNSYGAISDAKLKENVIDASPKLEDLMQVKVRNFNYIGSDKKQLGVVAQELEQVFPSMIDESPDFEEVEVPQLDENGQDILDENGEVVMTKERVELGTVTKSVKYSVFVPMLIKAIQELNAKVEALEAQLNA